MDDRRLDTLGQTIVSALPGAVTGHSVAFGQLTVTVEAVEDRRCRQIPARRSRLPLRQLHRRHRGGLSRPRKALRRGLSSAVADAERTHPAARGSLRDHAGAVDHRGVSRRRLVRARVLRPLRRDLHRPSRHAAAVDRLRFRRPSAAQGFSAHRLCRGALRRPGEARGLRAGAAQPGIPQFDFLSPWEGADYPILPGDEKAGPKV